MSLFIFFKKSPEYKLAKWCNKKCGFYSEKSDTYLNTKCSFISSICVDQTLLFLLNRGCKQHHQFSGNAAMRALRQSSRKQELSCPVSCWWVVGFLIWLFFYKYNLHSDYCNLMGPPFPQVCSVEAMMCSSGRVWRWPMASPCRWRFAAARRRL